MRRIAGIVATIAASVAGLTLVALGGQPAQSADVYRIDAIFDTAKGIIPGQLVKIAGARVGTIKDVKLTEDYKARIQLEVDQRFAPFREDARCEIRPEGLISENFVQCTPGTPDSPELKGRGGQVPTVGVERTSVPVNLSDLFEIFTVPVRARFTVLVANLGMSVAGRGEELNALLRRANPTLQQARVLIRRLNRQTAAISRVVKTSDQVIGTLAQRSPTVQRFIENTSRVTQRTARNREQLQASLRGLPPLLDEIEPTLTTLDRLAADATPVLRDLRIAQPQFDRLVDDLAPAAAAGRPALAALGRVSPTLRTASRNARPVVRKLRTFARAALPAGRMLNTLVVDMRDRGVTEGLSSFIFMVTRTLARFDSVSHILPAKLNMLLACSYTTTPRDGCSANYGGTQATAKRDSQRTKAVPKATPTPEPEERRARKPREPVIKAPKVPDVQKTLDDVLPGTVEKLDETLRDLLPGGGGGVDDLLGNGGLGLDPGARQRLEDLSDLLLAP